MQRVVIWFRKGLRLHDNLCLQECIDKKAQTIFPVFILDPWFCNENRVGVNRMRFLLESLRDLDTQLRCHRSRLLVLRGDPHEVLMPFMKVERIESGELEHKIDTLMFERDTEPYAKERDAKIVAQSKAAGIAVSTHHGHTLYDLDKLLQANAGVPPVAYQSFQTILSRLPPPAKALPAVSQLPPLQLNTSAFEIPALEQLGYKTPGASSKFPGGEIEALKRMAAYLKQESKVAAFEKPKTDPTAFAEPSTTVLSPYLKFGCLSPRNFYWALREIESRHKKHSEPPVSLVGQLLWREFFYLCGHGTPNYDKIIGNEICKQIPWDNDEKLLQAWTTGRTGYPWIDAVMTQLNQDGWMHHLARHCVACFLTRGDLWQSWEKGVEVFDRLLLDADWSLNNGNWMWLSASSFFTAYFRVYSPVAFPKKYDKTGAFVRRYLPVLKNMPEKFIYEPWKAPLEVQKKAGCVIGKDYPAPVVDHDTVLKRNLERMKLAFAVNGGSAGDDEGEEESKPVLSKRKSESAATGHTAAKRTKKT